MHAPCSLQFSQHHIIILSSMHPRPQCVAMHRHANASCARRVSYVEQEAFYASCLYNKGFLLQLASDHVQTGMIDHADTLPTFIVQHPTSNIQYPTSNIQYPTFNIQNPTAKLQNPHPRIPGDNVPILKTPFARKRRFVFCIQPLNFFLHIVNSCGGCNLEKLSKSSSFSCVGPHKYAPNFFAVDDDKPILYPDTKATVSLCAYSFCVCFFLA